MSSLYLMPPSDFNESPPHRRPLTPFAEMRELASFASHFQLVCGPVDSVVRRFGRDDFQLRLFERCVVPEETFDSFGWRLGCATFPALRGARVEFSKLLRRGFDFLILLNNFPSFEELVEHASLPVPKSPSVSKIR